MTLIEAVLWRRVDEPRFEHSRLMSFSEGFMLDGRALTVIDRVPTEAHYTVHCGPDWVTRFAFVHVLQGESVQRVQIRRDEDGRWWVNDEPRPDLDGIPDIDLALSPATNTLPIRRLSLRVGESQSVDATWVRFPELTCERLHQQYTRIADRQYRYETNSGAFVAELHVDEHGVVTRYGDLWDRV